MRIGIIGAGAVGGFMAGHLARAGNEVAVLARGANLTALKQNGVTVISRGERWTAPVTASDSAADLGAVDLAIVTAKGPSWPVVSEAMAPMLNTDTAVVCAMNGIPWWYEYGRVGGANAPLDRVDPGGMVWTAVGPQRAIGCVIDCPSIVEAPGVVRHNADRPGSFTLGEPAGAASDRVRAVASMLEGADMGAPVSDEIRVAIWAKLLVNLSRSPLGVLTGGTERGLADNPDTLAVTLAMMREGQAVAATHGLDVAVDWAANSDPAKRSDHKSSMLQDWELGRPMEIDGIVRVVQDFARAAGVETPTIDTVAALLVEKARMAGTY
jgi:2-dehydropantoate 2-reductase